jgi:hypothetical protein
MADDKQAKGQDDKAADDALKGKDSQDGKADGQDAGKHVSKESWDSLLAEKKKEQEEKRKLQAKIDKFEADQKKANDEKLKADGKLQELVDSKDKEISAKTERIRKAELKVAAKGAGLVDMDQVELLMKSATFNDQDELENGEELFKDLKEKKPFLFTQPEPDPKPGTRNTGASWKGGHIFTEAEVKAMDSKALNENWPEIQRQMGEGKIK